MKWYVQLSLDGWELDTLGPVTFEEACVVAKVLHKALKGLYGKATITTKPYVPGED